MKQRGVPVHGWVVLDKPLGLTSTQALGKVRRFMGGKKAGHGGTLDPLATGILPLAFGEATKLIPYVMDGDKEYLFTVRWGQATETDDAEGKVVAESANRPSEAEIRAALPSFIGNIEQVPPKYSAIKIDGERAYDLAREGAEVVMEARRVDIDEFTLVDCPDETHARFRVICGKGTYVRALARDLALKLGTYGHIVALRRTRVGAFDEKQAISLGKLEELSYQNAALTALLDISGALDDIPALMLTASEAQRLRAGMGVIMRPQHGDLGALSDADVIFAEHQGVPVALVEPKAGEFRVVRGFNFSN